MGLCPPLNYCELWNAVEKTKYSSKVGVKKQDMFNLFKTIQGIKKGYMHHVDWGDNKEIENPLGGMGPLNFGIDFASMGLGPGLGQGLGPGLGKSFGQGLGPGLGKSFGQGLGPGLGDW